MQPYGLLIFDFDGNLEQGYNYTDLVDDFYILREVQEVTPFRR